ncbi:site-2 protease family protein [Candidatus Saccharibacteria bacterium]|nr:site-2 protease family protein [Candidatus Saccharibacteria bacterium]
MNFSFVGVILILVITIFSVVLHELSHGLVAYWLGDRTAKDMGCLSLNPIKHIDPFMSILVPVMLYIVGAPVFGGAKPVPINSYNLKWKEWGMALVAIAGPLTNFLIALIAFLIGHFTGFIYGSGGDTLEFIFSELVVVNIGFMIFNIIPIPPLDGSRVLYAIAPNNVRAVMASMEQYGILIIYILILFFGQAFSGLMANGINGILHLFFSMV